MFVLWDLEYEKTLHGIFHISFFFKHALCEVCFFAPKDVHEAQNDLNERKFISFLIQVNNLFEEEKWSVRWGNPLPVDCITYINNDTIIACSEDKHPIAWSFYLKIIRIVLRDLHISLVILSNFNTCLIKSNKRESMQLQKVEEGRSRRGVEGSEGGGGVEGSEGRGGVKRWFSPGNLRDVNEW